MAGEAQELVQGPWVPLQVPYQPPWPSQHCSQRGSVLLAVPGSCFVLIEKGQWIPAWPQAGPVFLSCGHCDRVPRALWVVENNRHPGAGSDTRVSCLPRTRGPRPAPGSRSRPLLLSLLLVVEDLVSYFTKVSGIPSLSHCHIHKLIFSHIYSPLY